VVGFYINKIKLKGMDNMFQTNRTVYRHREGLYDYIDESKINIVSGYVSFRNKAEKKNAWKQIKREFEEYGDSLKIIIQDGILAYSIDVPRTHL
jgi:hypothetical protein